MNPQLFISQGEEKIMVEMTVKEALALGSGVRFNEDRRVLSSAQAKVRRTVERTLFPESDKIPFHSLEI